MAHRATSKLAFRKFHKHLKNNMFKSAKVKLLGLKKFVINMSSCIGMITIVIFIICIILYFIIPNFGNETETEIERIESPNGTYEAVITEPPVAAFNSAIYYVYIVLKGEEFKNENFQGSSIPSLKWDGSKKLIMTYSANASIYNFDPIWYEPRQDFSLPFEKLRRVSIMLQTDYCKECRERDDE